MVCLSSASPRAAALVRKGSRLAGRLSTDWFAVFVETPRETPEQIDAGAQRHLLANTDLARELGAEVIRLRARDPVHAILEFARSHGVGHVVVGRSDQPSWKQLFGRSIPIRLVREGSGLDVHVVATEDEGGAAVRLRTKLLLAQAPLAIALAGVGVLSAGVTSRLADQSRLILADNYRSVLAAQRMKEALERIDEAAVDRAGRRTGDPPAEIAHYRRAFENELAVQEGNITESGEGRGDAGAARVLERLQAKPRRATLRCPRPRPRAVVLPELKPIFVRIKAARRRGPRHQSGRDGAQERSRSERARLLEHIVTGAVVLVLSSGCSPPPG